MPKDLRYKTACFLLGFVVVVGFFLRIYLLDTVPYGALVDEAHFGYIAYSLLETGRDEHGKVLPLLFQGFGDQKLPAYGYLLVPFIWIFDLSVFSIRLPSALAGTALIIAAYVLARNVGFSRVWSLSMSALVAISPWSFILSRFGFESNVALLFWTFGLGLLASISKKTSLWTLTLTSALIAATWYSYIAYRPVTLMILLCITLYWFLTKSLSFKSIAVLWISFLIAILPLLNPAVSSVNTARFQQIGILSDPGIVMRVNENRTFCSESTARIVCDIVWNKASVIGSTIAQRFFATYSPEYLGFKGDGSRYLSVDSFGQMPWIVYPAFVIGLGTVVFGRVRRKLRYILFIGLLIAPLPAILAGEPQKVRLSASFPFILLIMTLGLEMSWRLFQSSIDHYRKRYHLNPDYLQRTAALSFAFVVLYISTQFFITFYFVHSQKNDFSYSSHARDIAKFTQTVGHDTQLYIRGMYSDPVMMHAFYTKYDPKIYQTSAVLGELEQSGFQHTASIQGFAVSSQNFEQIACDAYLNNQPTVLISDEDVSGVPLKPNHILARFMSNNGVYQYAAAYDLYTYASDTPQNCQPPTFTQ